MLFSFMLFVGLSITTARLGNLTAQEKADVKELTLTEDMNTGGGNDDLRQLRDLCWQLQKLDISGVVCDSLRSNAFHSRHKLKKIILPHHLRSIGKQAFFACDALREITIPASVVCIENRAFANCKRLRKVYFEGKTLPDIAPDAFLGTPFRELSVINANVNANVSSQLSTSALLPLPARIEYADTWGFPLAAFNKHLTIYAPKSLQNEKERLRDVISDNRGDDANVYEIHLQLSDTLTRAESYTLEIGRNRIVIAGADAAGVFYGIMTLQQLMLSSSSSLPAVRIYDVPRTRLRELMVDPCRHFIAYSDLERMVRTMARFKMNALHLHLADDQAWRIEIKKYPLLTKMGSKRMGMDDMLQPISGYYTQRQMRRLVAYAKKYHVEIIPEIEMPGHEVAAIHCYPQLTCGAKQVDIRTVCGVSNELLCPSSEFTYQFLYDVFDELAEVFPSEYVHLGGDEAGNPALDCWTRCTSCRALKREIGITSTDRSENWRLQQVLFDRVIGHLRDSLHKTPMFWYETDFRVIPSGCIVFAWRHGLTPTAVEAAKRNGAEIMYCSGEHCYFDYPARKGDMPEVNWGMPVTTLQQTYRLNPTDGYGVAGTLWSECIDTSERLFYMAFPRAIALAEVGWTPERLRSYDDFLCRLRPNLRALHQAGICTGDAY